jgi:hypothetical protein
MATVIAIINYNCTVFMIVNYNPKTFIVQATALKFVIKAGSLPKRGTPKSCFTLSLSYKY